MTRKHFAFCAKSYILADFSYVKRLLISIKEKADENNVYEVSAMADSMIAQYSKAVWMLEQSK